MKKRRLRYPVTVAFRTTEEIKGLLETQAIDQNKTVSELLQTVVTKGLSTEFLLIYRFLVDWLAEIRGRDSEWIKRKIAVHHSFMIYDAHHGYTEKEAMEVIKEEIEISLEIAKEKANPKKI